MPSPVSRILPTALPRLRGGTRRIVCLLLWCAAALHALDPSLAVSQYARKHWQVEDGLPQNYVTSITQEPGGLLVVGTSGGVARFDGLRFEPIVLEEETGISREWITALAVDHAGNLWIASRDAGLYLHKEGRTQRPRGSSPRLDSMAVLRDGSIAGIGWGTWRIRDEEPRGTGEDKSVDLSWEALLELPDGRMLMCTSAGVFAYRGEARELLLPSGAALGATLSLHRGGSGAVYLGTTTGLFLLDISDTLRARRVEGVKGSVVSIVEDRDGQIWAATWGDGLYRVRSGKAEQITSDRELPDDFVHTLHEDEEGSLWIGTRAGLSRWKSGPIVPYGPPEGLGAQFLSVVAGDGKDGLWVGSWRSGMHQMRKEHFTRYSLGSEEATTLIASIAVAPDGSLWYADWRKLNHATERGVLSYWPQTLGHRSRAEAILFDRQGRMWVGEAGGVHVYAGADISAPEKTWMRDHHVRCLLEARDGAVWVGTKQGLARIAEGAETQLKGLPHPDVAALHQDGNGRIWAATRVNGIVLIDGDTPRAFDQRHGLPALPVYSIQDDLDGNLWLSSPSGLFSIASEELDALVSGAGSEVNPVPYSDEDGLRTVEFQNVGFPATWRDARGSLWFASVQGLVEVRPRQVRALPPPVVRITGTHSRDRANEVRFTSNRLGSAGRVRFRYRVEGLQEEWILLASQRVLRLDSLPAGKHHVLLAAREEGGAWGPAASLWIVQPPRWFETWWFYAACVLLLLGLVLLVYRWRLSLVRARYALVTEERNRIGREWHDTLLAGFSAISWQLDAALKSLGDRSEPARDAIQIAGDMVRHYRTEARRVIWDLRHSAPEQESLPQAIERTLAEMAFGPELRTEVIAEGSPGKMDPELAQSVLRICQEAALNAARHAAAKHLRIHLDFNGSQLKASVSDDGKGFDPACIARGHFGLAIMRERATRYGGTLDVESAPGEGTVIRATLPLQTEGRT